MGGIPHPKLFPNHIICMELKCRNRQYILQLNIAPDVCIFRPIMNTHSGST